MVLSFVPSSRDAEPVTIQAADAVRAHRRQARRHAPPAAARARQSQPGRRPRGHGRAAREVGRRARGRPTRSTAPAAKATSCPTTSASRFIEKARALGVKVICVHKGLPFGRQSYEHSQCSDIGVVAKRFPDVKFLIYHSGFVTSVREEAYDPLRKARRHRHADPLTREERREAEQQRLRRARQHLALPDARSRAGGACAGQAAECTCGEDNVLWGTDSIWYGSPQDQIQAFRAFQISPAAARAARLPGDHARRCARRSSA